jgi:membrane-bound serine protease (ClpP class)
MIAIGVGLVLVGAALLVAEAHLPAGVLGVVGGLSLAGGAALVIAGAGGGLAIVLPVAAGAGAVACAWVAVATRKALAAQAPRARAGGEALSGRPGVVRNWSGKAGQVLVDGALWQARRSWVEEEGALAAGDPVVVERVTGLTLSVRKAEDWETPL